MGPAFEAAGAPIHVVGIRKLLSARLAVLKDVAQAAHDAENYANAQTILLLSSHLETGHYFNPHAQRIIEGKQRGAKLITVDPRLSNTASMADWWLAPWPGTEALLLLAFARVILDEAVATLKSESDIRVSVEGHTDAKGSDAYNDTLSENNAAARTVSLAGELRVLVVEEREEDARFLARALRSNETDLKTAFVALGLTVPVAAIKILSVP